jgi:hypothetical protein
MGSGFGNTCTNQSPAQGWKMNQAVSTAKKAPHPLKFQPQTRNPARANLHRHHKTTAGSTKPYGLQAQQHATSAFVQPMLCGSKNLAISYLTKSTLETQAQPRKPKTTTRTPVRHAAHSTGRQLAAAAAFPGLKLSSA